MGGHPAAGLSLQALKVEAPGPLLQALQVDLDDVMAVGEIKVTADNIDLNAMTYISMTDNVTFDGAVA